MLTLPMRAMYPHVQIDLRRGALVLRLLQFYLEYVPITIDVGFSMTDLVANLCQS